MSQTRQSADERRAEEELLAGMRRGDAGAIDRFYAVYFQVFLQIALRQIGDFFTAQDLAHDAILKVIKSAASYRPEAGRSPRTWLLTVLSNTLIDWTRGQRHRRARSYDVRGDEGSGGGSEPPAPDPGPLDRIEAAEKIAAVQAALMMLDEEQRRLVTLRMYEELSAAEMAEVLGTTADRVGRRLFRARQRLCEILQSHWPDLFP